MGQYYKPIFLNKKKNKPLGFFNSHDFGSGLKLMEHSWMKNDFVGFVERQLAIEPRPLVWAGDYADNEPLESLSKEELTALLKKDYKLEDLKEGVNLYVLARETAPKITHDVYFGKDKSKYDYNFKTALPKKFKYLINYDKKEFVNKSKTPIDDDGWQIHPLPLLTCEGNGRGGGDFRGDEKDLVGRWSRDTIGVSTKKSDIPKDFKEVEFNLTE